MSVDVDNVNHAHLIIDALLMRMSRLERYSDDERVIAERELLPLDVVVDEAGRFGVVHHAALGRDDDFFVVKSMINGVQSVCCDKFGDKICTIDETQSGAARAALAKAWSGNVFVD